MRIKNIFQWVLRLLAAVIMLQTLYFKFSGHPESIQLFTMLNMEPWGRIGIGVAELIAAVLLLISSTVALAALLGIGLMSGAIFFHFTKLGINFGGDSWLFTYALIVWLCCAILLFMNKQKLLSYIKK